MLPKHRRYAADHSDEPWGNQHSIKHCTVPLMPWSPFPCKFDPSVYNATPGQPTDLCTKELTNNGFLGTMPNLDRACFPDGSKGGRQLLGAKLGLKFKVAMGRQYDRSYSMFISDAVVSSQYCVRLDQHVSMTTALYSCTCTCPHARWHLVPLPSQPTTPLPLVVERRNGRQNGTSLTFRPSLSQAQQSCFNFLAF